MSSGGSYPVYAEALGGTGDPERTRGRKYHQPYQNTLDPRAAAPVLD
jgi:hypothetical protein